MAWYNIPEDRRNEAPDWQALVCADGTVGILSGPCSWQEFLCSPDEAWDKILRQRDDGA
jgi:hypothetical protein